MSSPSPVAAPTSPGWYDDPTTPGQDRWWSGSAWTELTEETPGRAGYARAYARSMRPGKNVDARRASLFGWIALAGLVAVLLAPSVVDVRIGVVAWSVVFFALAALALAVGILAIAFAMRALRRASTLGGSGTAIRSLVLGIAAVFFGLGSLVFGIIATLQR